VKKYTGFLALNLFLLGLSEPSEAGLGDLSLELKDIEKKTYTNSVCFRVDKINSHGKYAIPLYGYSTDVPPGTEINSVEFIQSQNLSWDYKLSNETGTVATMRVSLAGWIRPAVGPSTLEPAQVEDLLRNRQPVNVTIGNITWKLLIPNNGPLEDCPENASPIPPAPLHPLWGLKRKPLELKPVESVTLDKTHVAGGGLTNYYNITFKDGSKDEIVLESQLLAFPELEELLQ